MRANVSEWFKTENGSVSYEDRLPIFCGTSEAERQKEQESRPNKITFWSLVQIAAPSLQGRAQSLRPEAASSLPYLSKVKLLVSRLLVTPPEQGVT